MIWNRKHLLDLQSLSAEEIIHLLDTAREFKAVGQRSIKKVPALRGKTVINLFVEPSTRTRISFETAAKRLSADTMTFSVSTSSVNKGESLKDTINRVLPYWENAIVPELQAGKTVLISAHGNSLRALVKHLECVGKSRLDGLCDSCLNVSAIAGSCSATEVSLSAREKDGCSTNN